MSTHEDDNTEITYIGDGVYAEFDGYSVRLYTQQGNDIYLEPAEWNKLRIWLKDKM